MANINIVTINESQVLLTPADAAQEAKLLVLVPDDEAEEYRVDLKAAPISAISTAEQLVEQEEIR